MSGVRAKVSEVHSADASMEPKHSNSALFRLSFEFALEGYRVLRRIYPKAEVLALPRSHVA